MLILASHVSFFRVEGGHGMEKRKDSPFEKCYLMQNGDKTETQEEKNVLFDSYLNIYQKNFFKNDYLAMWLVCFEIEE